MQRFGGLLLMLMGTAALGSYLILPPPPDDDADLAEVTRISIAPYHPARTDNAVRSFAPASPVFHDIAKTDAGADVAPTDRPNTSSAWTTVVTADRSRETILRSSKPGDAATRYELARDLQRELKRAGCYGGEITGVWSPATKRAMSAFLDRANATLPINAPDYILLSLVQNHSEIACTAECPSGQAMDQTGRCVPSAVLAQASKRSQRIEANRAMDLDTPTNTSQPRVAAAPERLPWLDSNGRSVVTPPPPAPRGTPPPGMMSIGGPAVASSQPSSQGVTIERDNGTSINGASGSVADPGAANVASVMPDDGTAGSAAGIDPDGEAIAPPIKRTYTQRAHRDRPRQYGYGGKRRRGDPRPGTMRYNLVQALGGIY